MTPDTVGPLSRPFPLHRVKPEGVDVVVQGTAEERARLAADFGLAAIHALEGRFRVSGVGERVRVAGKVSARIEQVCVVTLDRFETEVEEDVELQFEPTRPGRPASGLEVEIDDGAPEELTGDRIDLGAIMAEFLALGLDPYPRKPGASFEAPREGGAAESPFARLGQLRPKREQS